MRRETAGKEAFSRATGWGFNETMTRQGARAWARCRGQMLSCGLAVMPEGMPEVMPEGLR
ncbi:Hypothetical protein CAP_1136 [Chondromyces apiculatus DSM 436]|uniref:Uncharacterized protein n=1 Tax=Chondromyces apiculatus DSM 436 TaxID=1192034 RepID=A0A017ST69_9BACT|nr:Hypothetical protein CAP_1136 [Chondromyces apiculatus DSM 436]